MAPSPLRRWRWRILAGVAALALAALAVRAWMGPRVPTWAAERRELVQRVVASGRVLAPARVQVGSVVVGRAVRVPVEKGDRVKAGDVLVQLDEVEAKAALAQARAQVAQAAARLEQVEVVSVRVANEGVRQSELRLAQAEDRLTRQRTLAEAGSVSRSDLDDAQKARDLAASQLTTARIQQSAATSGADRRAAVAALEQARGAEAAAAARLEQLAIRAPASGVITEREIEPGDVVQPGRTLLVLARDGDTQLSVQPDEKNLALLRLGQPATASADAYPERIFPARVAWIAPAVDLSRGTVEVKLDVPAPPEFLRPDMTVSVNVEVGRDPAALVVPASAVRDPASPDPWVLAVRGGRAVRQPVRLGMRGEGAVQVLSGLEPGEAVIATTAPAGAGDRVRAGPAR
ncbi:MAG TPA: efflux RND transporter periplasmic adaptor subunit [Anaeromyxobacteraceae bacterium]|nr:efflux RND transporter periplasmic adaptor subunit [Anaeromyxobacteraceae bacterium]